MTCNNHEESDTKQKKNNNQHKITSAKQQATPLIIIAVHVIARGVYRRVKRGLLLRGLRSQCQALAKPCHHMGALPLLQVPMLHEQESHVLM